MRSRVIAHVAIIGILAASAALAACSDDNGSPSLDAELKLVHADPTVGAVDVVIGGTTVIHNVAYGEVSPLANVPGGVQTVVLRSSTGTVAQVEGDLSTSSPNSLLLGTGGEAQFANVTPDTGAVATNRANIRMVNVVGSNSEAPTLLDVKVTAPAPDTVMTFGVDTQIARYGTLMYFDPGEFTFRFQPAGESTILTQVTFTVAAGETKDVVLERAADGTYSASVVVEQAP